MATAKLRRAKPFAAFAHFGPQERLGDHDRFRVAQGDDQAALFHRDPGLGRDSGPDVARSPGQGPALAALLARNGDEAEIADRRAVGAGIAVDDHDALARLGRGEGVGEADNSRADDGQVKT